MLTNSISGHFKVKILGQRGLADKNVKTFALAQQADHGVSKAKVTGLILVKIYWKIIIQICLKELIYLGWFKSPKHNDMQLWGEACNALHAREYKRNNNNIKWFSPKDYICALCATNSPLVFLCCASKCSVEIHCWFVLWKRFSSPELVLWKWMWNWTFFYSIRSDSQKPLNQTATRPACCGLY